MKQYNIFRPSALFIFVSLLLSCGDPIPEEKTAIPTGITTDTNANESKRIKSAGLSFYKWYLDALNKDSITVSFEGDVIKDANGMCRLDLNPYFLELKKLNTVSEKFMEKERARLKECTDFIATVPFIEYENADAYTYDKHCGSFYYYYWIRSQELFESCDSKSVTMKGNNAAYLDVYFTYKGESEDKTPLSRVYLEKENSNWMIVDIKFKDALDE